MMRRDILNEVRAADDGGAGGSANGTADVDISGLSPEQVGAYLSAHAEDDSVRPLIERFNPLAKLTDDKVDELVQANPLLLRHRNSYADQAVSKGIETFKAKHFDELYRERYNKEHPPETDEAKRIRELEDRVAATERERTQATLRSEALTSAADLQIPTELVDLCIGEDSEATAANMKRVKSALDAVRKAEREAVVDRHGRVRIENGGGAGANGAAGWSRDEILAMDRDQINANWDKPGFQDAVAAASRGA